MPPNTLSKICSHEKTVLNYSSRTFCTEKLLKTPSTTSKHSSEKYRTKVLPITPSMKRIQKTGEKECSSKSYFREMLPRIPLKSLSIRTFIETLFKNYRSKKHAQNSANAFLSKEGRIDFLVKKYHAKVPSTTVAKTRWQQKLYWSIRHDFLSEKAA